MRVALGVNIDHVATVRNARGGIEPDPIHAAVLVEQAGAQGITIHLREDRRHIRDRDLELLKQIASVPLNLEMAATESILQIALAIQPEQVTLVPERREEVTTEGGLDVKTHRTVIAAALERLRGSVRRLSLFIDPEDAQIRAAAEVGADRIELHTGRYAAAEEPGSELEALERAATLGAELGLGIAAGHGLNYQNVVPVAAIPEMEELNIGHSIVSRALMVGLPEAVRSMMDLIRLGEGRSGRI